MDFLSGTTTALVVYRVSGKPIMHRMIAPQTPIRWELTYMIPGRAQLRPHVSAPTEQGPLGESRTGIALAVG